MEITQIVDKLKSDPALLAKYRNLTSIDAIVSQAKIDGFDVNAADVVNIMSAIGGSPHGSLSEEELASVAGGDEDVEADKDPGDCPQGGKHDWQFYAYKRDRCSKCGRIRPRT